MSRLGLFPDGYGEPTAAYSSVVVSEGLAFVSGQVPLIPSGSLVGDVFAEQAGQVLANLRASLAAAGCVMDDVLKVTVLLARTSDFDEFNHLYREWFSEPFPARTTFQVGLVMGFLLEVEAIARLPAAVSHR